MKTKPVTLQKGTPKIQLLKESQEINSLGFDLLAYVQKGKEPQIYVNRLGEPASRLLLTGQGIHAEKWDAAYRGTFQQYEWMDTTRMVFFQTNLLPLPSQGKSKEPQILVTVRNISLWAQQAGVQKDILRDSSVRRTLAQLLLAAREEEKKNISKALHDEIGSSAVVLTSLIGLTRGRLQRGETEQALDYLQQLNVQVKQSIERLKNIVVSLRPLHLEQDGSFVDAVRTLVENVGTYAALKWKFSAAASLNEKGISDNIKIMLYRVVQEALSNVVKHAHAKKVHVKLVRRNEWLYLSVQDDGIGFEPQQHTSINHIGLPAMKESISLLGGEIMIQSAHGKGTCIQVECPCVVYEEHI